MDKDTGHIICSNDFLTPLVNTNHLLNSSFLRGVSIFDAVYAFYDANTNKALIFRLDQHIERLLKNARTCCLKTNETFNSIKRMAVQTVEANKFLCPQYIDMRLVCFTCHPQAVDYSNEQTSLIISIHKMREYIPLKMPAKVAIVPYTRDPVFGRVKLTGEYSVPAILHNNAIQKGFTTVLFKTHTGVVLESAFANIFGVWNGQLYTPSLSLPIIAGVTRDSIINLAKKNGIKLNDSGIMTDSDLRSAGELFLTGTSTKVTPITKISFFEDYEFNTSKPTLKVGDDQPGPITRLLMEKYDDLITGKSEYEDLNEKYITTVKY
ncbi:MAG: aminotransferase class IV [Parcubacteria group bacterium]|nr:aminotransferase class IV [Parcubacteria group bacterium]